MISFARRSSVAVFLIAAGCSSSAPESSNVVCEPSPEPALHGQALVGNSHMQNGQMQNGQMQNGRMQNGQTQNGVQMNGMEMNGLSLNGTELSVTTADGATLRGPDVVGRSITGVLSDGSTIDVAITAYAVDAGVAYYTLATGGQPLCTETERGVLVPGVWDESGARHDALTVGGHLITASYSCMDGAIGKCVAWGYDPAKVGTDLHQSCTRMVRADYCGTGVSFTKDGTTIDIFDARGIEQPTAGDASLVFEAAWTTAGAACVNRTRYDRVTSSGAAVLPSCWDTLPKCGTWEEAQQKGAVLGNASRIQSIATCN